MTKATIAAGVATITAAAIIWKGRNIRAKLSAMGEGWDRLHPQVRQKAEAVMRDAWLDGLRVGIFAGYRDKARQQELMGKGRSWVGDADSSYHRWGLAVDFVFLDALGRWTWEPEGGMDDWHRLGAIIERHGFQWGGRWRTFDGPHAQLPIQSIAELKRTHDTPEDVAWA